MRRLSRWVLVTSLVLSGAVASARAEGNDLTGQRAPEIYVQEGVQGIATGASLSAYRGQVVVLKFWFTRCPACRRSLPEFQTLFQRYSPRGVQFLAIAYDETSNVRSYLRSTGFTFPVAIDGGGVTATRYGVFTYPTTYVIGADGVVKAYDQLSGPLLERELEAARAAPRPNAGRRPLASFPRQAPVAQAPGAEPTGPVTPASHPVAQPSVPPAVPPVTAMPPVAAPAVPEAPAMAATPPTPPAAPVAAAHPAAPAAQPEPLPAGLATLPLDPSLPSIPSPTAPETAAAPPIPPATAPAPDPTAESVARGAGPDAATPVPVRVESGSIAPSSPTTGAQPASRESLVIPPDPAATPPPAPLQTARTAPAAAAETAPTPPPPFAPAALPPTPPSAPTVAAPFAAAPDLVLAGDFPAVLRMVEAYASAHPDASTWAAADLDEARRLEGLVRAKYREQNNDARTQWAQGATEPAIEAARALRSAYRGTALEPSAADLVTWFEAHRSPAPR